MSKQAPVIRLGTIFEKVMEMDPYSGAVTTYDQKTHQEDVKGFWLKIYGPAIDGKRAIREWCYPTDTRENFVWQTVAAPPRHEMDPPDIVNPDPTEDIKNLITPP